MARVDRQTVDLSGFPNLVVVYLGMRVNALAGVKTLLGFGPKISRSVAARPDGLLLHENIFYSLIPPHVGMRQYWRRNCSAFSSAGTLACVLFPHKLKAQKRGGRSIRTKALSRGTSLRHAKRDA
jgi:hypothetical protein